jgi:hypothetical protein
LLEVVGHDHLGQLHALVLGDVVADHLVRLLEAHHQRLALGARRDVEAVEVEIVLLDADMDILEGGKAGEAGLAFGQAGDRHAGECAGARQHGSIVNRALDGALQPGDHRLGGILRCVEQEIRFRHVLGRFALAGNGDRQIGGNRKRGDIGSGVQQVAEIVGIRAGQRCAGIAGLQAFEIGLAGEHICHGKPDHGAAAGAEQQRMLVRRQHLVGRPDRLDRTRQLDLAGAPDRAGRDRRHKAAAGAGEGRARRAAVVFEYDDLGDEALGDREMLEDIVLGNCRKARV